MRNTDYIKGALLRDDYSGINDIEAEAGDFRMPRNMMWLAHPVVWIEREMERAWETALLPESVIVLLRMADVSVF